MQGSLYLDTVLKCQCIYICLFKTFAGITMLICGYSASSVKKGTILISSGRSIDVTFTRNVPSYEQSSAYFSFKYSSFHKGWFFLQTISFIVLQTIFKKKFYLPVLNTPTMKLDLLFPWQTKYTEVTCGRLVDPL